MVFVAKLQKIPHASILPWPENSRTDPDKGGAAGYGGGVVVAHPHRDSGEPAQVWTDGADFVEGGADGAEVGFYPLSVVGVGGHAHNSAYVDGFQLLEPSAPEPVEEFSGGEPEFRLLPGDMELHQDVLNNPLPLSLAVYLLQEPDGIDALDQHRAQAQQLSDFVGLQVADEMPRVFLSPEFRHFGGELLDAALSEKPLPGGAGLAQGFHRVEFRHGHKIDVFRQRLPDRVESCLY